MQRLAAHVAATQAALARLEGLAAALDATGADLRGEAAAATEAAAAKRERALRYEAQQAAIAARLQAVGCCPEVRVGAKDEGCREAQRRFPQCCATGSTRALLATCPPVPNTRLLQIGHTALQARGRERGRVLAELQTAETELTRYRGLPADAAAARAATAEKRAELGRLRARLQEHLNAMQ
jgi:hypothetical protein